MISGRGDNAGQTAPSPTCSRSPTVWCCAAAGTWWSRSGWRLRPVVIRPDSGGVPIRADPSLAEPGNVDVGVLPPILDGVDDSLAAHPVLIGSLKSVPQTMFC
jgi:hypothetical protein